MWNYEKRLEYPINIKQTNPALAAMIISQYGGPDGELGASMRYISQRYTMPDRAVAALPCVIFPSVLPCRTERLLLCSTI